jgi:hypothetical protein
MYKINGYILELVIGMYASDDRTTADSFERPPGVLEPETYQWAEGILEVNLLAPIIRKPREFILKGTIVVDNADDYVATKMAINDLLYDNYVTLEATHLGVKANARLTGEPSWHRLTNLDDRIAVAVSFTFNELLQPLAYKDNGQDTLNYYITNGGEYILTENDENYIA